MAFLFKQSKLKRIKLKRNDEKSVYNLTYPPHPYKTEDRRSEAGSDLSNIKSLKKSEANVYETRSTLVSELHSLVNYLLGVKMLILLITVLIFLLCQAGASIVSLRWPAGIYGLPKPTAGCPQEWKSNRWEENGRIRLQIWHSSGHANHKSDHLHLAGYVKPNDILIYFCISKATGSAGRPTWPKGEYCIYSKHDIKDMLNGYIRHRHYYGYITIFANDTCRKSFFNTKWGYTYLHFKCQTSGNKKIPISLPITKPFYLLPYGSRACQQVKWMVATSEWIKYHTYYYSYSTGRTPYHAYNMNGLTMYYCYYESCNYTLTDKEGVFQSPGFPGKYPDGQLCSWRIMVPENHTLHVRFTNFSLYQYDKDCLQLYENDSGIFKPRQAFFGNQEPFNITANNEVMFVFRSDEENNSNGFQAEYEILKIPERTTSTTPPTTTTHPTTTSQPTTKLTTTKLPTTKQPTTTQTTKRTISTEETTLQPTATNSTTNETMQCNPTSTKNKSYDKHFIHPLREKTCFWDETWRIVVMVIPLAVLIVLVSIDIFCRCRSKEAIKSGTNGSSTNDEMVVNPMYERGNIILDQPADSLTVASTANTTDDLTQSHDDPPDYEDVDYTQLNDIPPPRRSSKRQECHALEPVGADHSAAFYHVLEPNGTQSHATESVCDGSPVFYHTLEQPTGLNTPAYQNLSEVNQYTMNPLYEASDNSPPLVEANRLYDNYMA